MTENQILDAMGISRTLKRIAHEILEANPDNRPLVLVGIKTRGEYLAQRLAQKIKEIEGIQVPVELLDITFYRDDMSHKGKDPFVQQAQFKEDIQNKRVIIVDDVLYTGRTVRAAMDAILSQGRPSHIHLAILVDRGHRELPIRPDFIGKNVPTSRDEKVAVRLSEIDDQDHVVIMKVK